MCSHGGWGEWALALLCMGARSPHPLSGPQGGAASSLSALWECPRVPLLAGAQARHLGRDRSPSSPLSLP